jgi:prepilin-type N-terminal cleavage/methylation domain-containing protein
MRRTSEAGFTLIELLVVMVLMGIVGGFVTTSLVRSMQVTRTTSERAIALHDIERSLQVVGRELRVADPIYLAADDDFQNVIGAEVVRDRTIQVHTFLIEEEDGIQFLFQEITEYDMDEVAGGDPLTATPTTPPRRRLITDVDNGIEAVFTYHTALGTEIECDPLTEANCADRFADASQIGIRLVRNLDGQEPIRAETRINVRNTRYGRA